MVPKIIHQIWIGKKSNVIDNYRKTIKKFGVGFQYKLWTEKNISEFNLQEKYRNFSHPAFFADIYRIHILNKYGGIYIDADMEAIRPINILWDKYKCYPISSCYYKDHPDLGVIMSQHPYNFWHHISKNFNPTKSLIGSWRFIGTKKISDSYVGKSGSILKNKQLNSWF